MLKLAILSTDKKSRNWRPKRAPTHGMPGMWLTADELAEQLDMDRYSIQPRTSELRKKGFIRDSGRRRKNSDGKMEIVWIPNYLGTETEVAI